MEDFLDKLELKLGFCELVWFTGRVEENARCKSAAETTAFLGFMGQAGNVAIYTLTCFFSGKLLKRIRPLEEAYLTDK